jgi:hypothetical protein
VIEVAVVEGVEHCLPGQRRPHLQIGFVKDENCICTWANKYI